MFVAQLAMVCGPASSRVETSGPLVKLGASLTAVTLMLKVCGALVSLPPLAVPPLSRATIVMRAVPLALAAAVNVSVPVGAMAGPEENNPGLVLLVTMNVIVWPASFAGPTAMLVAQLLIVWATASSSTVTSGPLVKLGGSLTELTVIVAVAVVALKAEVGLAPPLLTEASTMPPSAPVTVRPPVRSQARKVKVAGPKKLATGRKRIRLLLTDSSTRAEVSVGAPKL